MERLGDAARLLRANPNAWATVREVLREVEHDLAGDGAEEVVARTAAAFDRAAGVSPEGSVALYALGSPDLLRAVTAEVVMWMRAAGLLGPDRRVLDLGCGIGRVAEALAGEVGSVTGVDVSGAMVEAARRRCATRSNVSFLQTSGRDLSVLADGSFDVVLAVDSFPYLVQAGTALVERHVAEAARVLAPEGHLLVLNFSYRGDLDRDRADVARLAAAHGFSLAQDGARPFSLWDGAVFHLAKTLDGRAGRDQPRAGEG